MNRRNSLAVLASFTLIALTTMTVVWASSDAEQEPVTRKLPATGPALPNNGRTRGVVATSPETHYGFH